MELGETFFRVLQEVYQGIFEVIPKEDSARVWTYYKKPFQEGESIIYSESILEFIDRYIFPYDQQKCFKLISREALLEFMRSDEKKKVEHIRFRNEVKRFVWYEIQLLKMDFDKSRLIIFVKENDRCCRNEILSMACQGDYDYIIYINFKDGLSTMYPNNNLYSKSEICGEDYEERIIHFIYDYIVPEKIDETLTALSLHEVKKQLSIRNEYEFYTAIVKEKKVMHKKYRFVYLNEKKEIILMSRTDVTEQINRQLREKEAVQYAYLDAVRANASKMEFLSRMSHDIRTPLNAILGMAMLAGMDVSDKDKVTSCLNEIVESGNYLLSLVNDILDISRSEAGTVDVLQDPLSMKELIKDVVGFFQEKIRKKKIQLQMDLSEMEYEWFLGDEKKLNRIVGNIVGNAVKYTEEDGTIAIRITSKKGMKEDLLYYRIDIEDDGIGMDQDFIESAFEPFSRADDAVRRGIPGTGLGLSIAENLIHTMNGVITLSSEKGKGTTFSIHLNCKKSDPRSDKDFHSGYMKIQQF